MGYVSSFQNKDLIARGGIRGEIPVFSLPNSYLLMLTCIRSIARTPFSEETTPTMVLRMIWVAKGLRGDGRIVEHDGDLTQHVNE